MDFYVPVGAIIIELEDCSDHAAEIESGSILHDEAISDLLKTATQKNCTNGRGVWVLK